MLETDEGDVVLGKPENTCTYLSYDASKDYKSNHSGSRVVWVNYDEVGPVCSNAAFICAIVAPVAGLKLERQSGLRIRFSPIRAREN